MYYVNKNYLNEGKLNDFFFLSVKNIEVYELSEYICFKFFITLRFKIYHYFLLFIKNLKMNRRA